MSILEIETSATAEVAATVPAKRSRYAVPTRAEAARVYDIRIATDLPEHRKVAKLRSLLENVHPHINLGDKGFRCLIQLWARAARYHRSGTICLTIENVEFEAGWREGLCPPEHHGVLVRALIQAGFLVEAQADAVYELHDWAEHQPWVTEGLRASAAGRFHKLVGLARTRDGLSHEEALRFAHARVPEYAQLTKTTLEDQLDAIADVPEQLEIASVGPSKSEILGEKPTPRTRRTGSRARESVDSVMQKIEVPDGLDAAMLRRFLDHRAALRTLKVEECKALVDELHRAVVDGIDLGKLLQLMTNTGYTDVPVTIRFNRSRLLVAEANNSVEPTADLEHTRESPPRPIGPRIARSRTTATEADDEDTQRINELFLRKFGLDLTAPDATAVERFFAGQWPSTTASETHADVSAPGTDHPGPGSGS
jgi:hypothetical protein